MDFSDGREGLESISQLDADIRCLGRRAFIAKHNLQGDSSRASTRGDRIHSVLDGSRDLASLTASSDKFTTERIMYIEAQIIDEYNLEGAEFIREGGEKRRLWLRDDEGNKLFSGRLDLVALDHPRVLIMDYKTGFVYFVPIHINWQIKGAMVLAMNEYGGEYFIGVLNHPHHPDVPYEIVECQLRDVQLFEMQIKEYLSLMTEDAPRTPNGISCMFCPGKDKCPEYTEKSKLALKAAVDEPLWEQLSPEQRGHRLEMFKVAKDLVKRETEAYEVMLKNDPESVANWKLVSTGVNKNIIHERAIPKIYEKWGDGAVTASAEISLSKLCDWLVENIGYTKKDAKQIAEEALFGAIEYKPKKESLRQSFEKKPSKKYVAKKGGGKQGLLREEKVVSGRTQDMPSLPLSSGKPNTPHKKAKKKVSSS